MITIVRTLKLFAQLLLMFGLVLLYFNWEELGGEIRHIYYQLLPIAVPSLPEWNHTRAVLPHLPPFRPLSSNSTSSPEGCTMPVLDPWDPSILPYVIDVPVVVCSSSQKSLLYTRLNKLHLNMTAMKELGLQRNQISCTYRYIRRDDSDHYTFLPEEDLEEEVVMLSPDYNSVWVTCRKVAGLKALLRWVPVLKLYENILLYLPARPALAKVEEHNRTKYSVILLLIDSVSQLNLIRSFPKTKELMDSLGGILFKGHHKVGHNSWPNVMAILGGEVKPIFPVDLGLKECYYMEDHHKPILLQEFGSHGWTTMHVEDFQLYANFAREGKMAYRHSPAHHDYRAAFWALTKEKSLGLGGGGLRNRLVGKADNYACQQELLAHTHQFRILEDFLTGQPGPVFAFFHLNEYTHNVPAMAAHYDPSLYKLLHSLIDKGSLNNTFFFLLADHGFMRADNPFTMTEQGKIENNMPALMLLPPSSLANNHPEMLKALKENTEVLTAHHDLYRTLREVMELGVGEGVLEERNGGYGESLLHPIKPRNCDEAGVAAEYCSCSNGIVKLESEGLEPLGRALLQDLDTYLEPLGLCRSLQLGKVKEATMRQQGQSKEGEEEVMVIGMQLEVIPSPGLFQATLYLNLNTSSLQSARLVRLDWYTITSGCVPSSQPHLRPYCIC